MLRRHFFLAGALVVLIVMVVFGGLKLASIKAKTNANAAAAGQGGAGAPGGGGGPGGGAGARGGAGGPGGARGGAAQVTAAVIRPHTFTDEIEVLGVAKGRQSVTLTAAATQLVQRIHFTDGQSVKRGALLVELQDSEQDAGLAQSEARLVQAQKAFERYKALNDKGYASRAILEQNQAALTSAQADVNAAKARQNDRNIRAPFAGVVGLSDVAPGALVNPGAPIVTLDDLSSVRVDFQIPERFLAQVHDGLPITAKVDAFPGEVIHGRISKIDTRVDERTRAITARAEFPNSDRRLKPGMMVRVGIAQGRRDTLAAPETSVSVQGNSAFVFVIKQQGQRTMAEQRPVLTGIRQDGMVEITDGVTAGERVVADGLNKIQPGMTVRVTGGAAGRGPGGAGGAGRPNGGPPGAAGPQGAAGGAGAAPGGYAGRRAGGAPPDASGAAAPAGARRRNPNAGAQPPA